MLDVTKKDFTGFEKRGGGRNFHRCVPSKMHSYEPFNGLIQ